jgi:VanZ family protein
MTSSPATTATRIWRLVAVAFLLFLLLVVYWADRERIPRVFTDMCNYPGGDKLGHLGLYGMFAFLGAKAWRRPLRLARLSLPAGLLPAALLASLEELSQLFVPGRSADWLDLGAGFLGIGAAALLATVGPLRNRAPRTSTSECARAGGAITTGTRDLHAGPG